MDEYLQNTEWEKDSSFYNFISTTEFQEFVSQVKNVITAPPGPQIYETDIEPTNIFTSPLTEVFRVKIGESGDSAEIQKNWEAVVDAALNIAQVDSIHGTSLNLDEKLFVGAFAWEGLEVSLSQSREQSGVMLTAEGERQCA
jgi:hypothetical protein